MFKDTKPEYISPKKAKESHEYYLCIKSGNLSNYFGFGSIYPLALEDSEIYKNENREKDILSRFPEHIVFFRTQIPGFDNDDVLIELVLDGYVLKEIENSNLAYVEDPIPISRVKSLYFKTEAALTGFRSSIMTFPDCFIPSSICKIIPKQLDSTLTNSAFEGISLPKNETMLRWKSRLELYDRVLGLFGFIKNAGVLHAEQQNRLEEYTPSFFRAIGIINQHPTLTLLKENIYLKTLLSYQNFEVNNPQRAVFKRIIDRVYSNRQFDIKTAIETLEHVLFGHNRRDSEFDELKALIELFKQMETLGLSYKSAMQRDVFRKNLPALALLFLSKFSNKSRGHSDKQAVRNALIEESSLNTYTMEYLLGILGLYYGYKNMVREDTNLRFADRPFAQMASYFQSIKFRMESYLDRFIVESAFQYAAKGIPLNDTFEYLKWTGDSHSHVEQAMVSNYRFDYNEVSTPILGQKITIIERRDKTEKVYEQIKNSYGDKVEGSSYLMHLFLKYCQIDKTYIIETLRKAGMRFSIEELEKVIDLDTKKKISK